MEGIRVYLEQLIGMMGVGGDYVPMVRYGILVILAFALAWLAGWVCRRFLVPVVLKITRRTDAKWDDVLFNRRVLMRLPQCTYIWFFNERCCRREVHRS